MEEIIERMENALSKIYFWCKAYPTDIFPTPKDSDFKKAHEILQEHGISLSQLFGEILRHTISGFQKYAEDGLGEEFFERFKKG